MVSDLYIKLKKLKVNIRVVNENLDLKAPRGVLTKELLDEIRSQKKDLIEFINSYKDRKEDYSQIPKIPERENYPLSTSQRMLWVLSQMEEANVGYNIPAVHVFEGRLDREAFAQSFNTLLERHENLRTVFRVNGEGEPRQFILSAGDTGFRINDLDLRHENRQEEKVHDLIRAASLTPFDLSSGPLLRADLYRLSEEQWVFSYVMHHIISDGWSMGVLIKELLQLYNAFSKGQPNPLPSLRIQYKDYVSWNQEQLEGDALKQHKAYWLNQFSGELPVLALPSDKIRPSVKTYQGSELSKNLGPDVLKGLHALCQEQGATLFMGLLSSVNALLYRYTGQEDIVIGTPIAGREHADLEDQIGFYVNTLALRSRFKGSNGYKEILDHVKQLTLKAYEHQVYPFSDLVEALNLKRDISRNPLFDVQVILRQQAVDHSKEQQSLESLKVSAYEGEEVQRSVFDMVFSFFEAGEELHVSIQYNSDVYTAAAVDQLARHLQQFMLAIIASPSSPIRALDYLNDSEKQELTETFNSALLDYPKEQTVLDLFATQVAEHPDAIALVFEGIRMTYRELDEKSSRLARYLMNEYQLRADDLVGIMLDRSEKMIIGILGILKAGGAYVPIDPEYPAGRKKYIIEDTGIRVLLTQTDYLFDVDYYTGAVFAVDVQSDVLDTPALASQNKVQPKHLAYVIYTSGSTGNPKGVLITHSSLMHSTVPREQVYKKVRSFLLLSSIAFDSSVAGIFGTLCYGGSLCITRKIDVANAGLIAGYIAEHSISHLLTVPSYYKLLLAELADKPNKLEQVIVAGEYCPGQLITQHFSTATLQHCDIFNEYGPTEGTVWSTVHRYGKEEALINTIGKPVPNVRLYILGPDHELVPKGVIGELCIGGGGLARGYLNKDELTKEKFVSHPFKPGERIYKTGDLGRWLPDGSIDFIGRKDDQVKINGYRIELGEIENALQAFPEVDLAVVTVKSNAEGARELVAYIVAKKQLSAAELQTHLKGILPAYSVPAYYVQLKALPLSPNGKVDKKKLPDPQGLSMSTGVPFVAPRNETEEKLVRIWQEVLGKEKISVKDNFFDAGGHSLKAIWLIGQIHKEFGVKIELKDIFSHATLEEQAVSITQSPQLSFTKIPHAPLQPDYPLSSSQQRLWILAQLEEGSVAYNMPGVYVFEGTLNMQALEFSFDQLIARHEILRTVFKKNEQGEVRQFILAAGKTGFKIAYRDLRSEAGREVQLKELVYASFLRPFNFETGPLLRANLYQVEDNKWIFSYVMHHIISDGVSMDILIGELLKLYNAKNKGEANPLTPLQIQYKDYATWQQAQVNGDALKRHKEYWLKQLDGEVPVLDFPADKPRPAIKTYNGAAVEKRIGNLAKIRSFSQEQGGTVFMGLLSTVNALLYRYTMQSDIIIGSPIAGREHADLDNQIGFYVNTLPLRTRFRGEDSFNTLFSNIRQLTLGAYEHQVYPFDDLVRALNLQRDISRNALFDVGMVFQEAVADKLPELGELKVSAYGEGEHLISLFDIIFIFSETGGELDVKIQFNSDIYTERTMQQLAEHLGQLLQAVMAQPDQPLSELDLVGNEEKQQLLTAFNDTAVAYPENSTITGLFEARASAVPSGTALVFGNKTVTYKELNERSNQLGAHLRKKYGINANDLVGIKLERSEWMVIAILGVLKSGGAYVPVDPEYPEDRIAYMLADSGCKAVIDAEELKAFMECSGQYSTENLTNGAGPADLAYVIYTSGSTGMPKGVQVSHRSLSHFFAHVNSCYSGVKPVVQPFIASASFDISIFQLFTPLLAGGTSIIVSKEQLHDMPQFTAILEKATYIDTVPAVYHLLANYILEHRLAANFTHIERLFIGGDAIPDVLLHRLSEIFSSAVITVTYGPTEATIFCTQLEHQPGTISTESKGAVIGRPIGNTQVYILNDRQKLCPAGMMGEICVGGNGLAKAYLNNPQLTAEKFIAHPFKEGERIYRTGDLGRWTAGGQIVFAGRNDAQVKVRGFRIELGEIERNLEQHGDINRAVVLPKKDADGNNYLVGYVEKKKRVKLTPSTSEFFVYDGLLYYALTTNEKRNGHYRRVFNKLLKDKVVLDLGTGADAILSRFCVDAGARKVYAVEILEETYNSAKKRIRELGLEDKIILIHGNITEIRLPEQVDYCVSEIVGSIGGSEGAAKLINATRKFLKDPANMLPKRSLTKIAAACLPDDLHQFTFDEVGDHYIRRIFDQTGYKFDVRMCVEHFPLENVISNHEPFEDLDFTRPIQLETEHDIRLEFTRNSVVNGFIVWLNLYIDETELIDSLNERYNWLPVYLPVFYNDTRVSEGDYIEAKIERKLADNGLNPDFIITGTLFRKNAPPLEFSFKSSNHEQVYRANPFYQKLFENDNVKVREDLSELQLRSFLKTRLPGHMVPSHLLLLDQLPLTPNGKIDRKALPDPVSMPSVPASAFMAPRNEIEQHLVNVFEEVLRKQQISVNEDFFAMGGDSIKSIQIVSRLKQRGYSVGIQEILLNPTVESLAAHVKLLSRIADQQTVEGPVPLSPVQKFFFGKNLSKPHHYNQSVLLYSKKNISEEGIKAVFDHIVLHHDTLRMVYRKTASGWVQENRGKEQGYTFELLDYTDDTAFKTHCERIQSGMDLEKGPLFKVALFRHKDGDRLLMVAHHLLIDGVSWRILFEDMSVLYQQYLSGEAFSLPLKTDSFRYWQEKLQLFAATEGLQKELGYWSRLKSGDNKLLPKDHVQGSNFMQDVSVISFALDEALTDRLLGKSYKAYNTGINDILIAALVLAVHEIFGLDKILLRMEGHGREDIGTDVDISRTVGWFTTVYPVAFDMSHHSDIIRQLIEVKETLHRVPNKGIGYGVLRYLADKDLHIEPQIAFNYLGDFGTGLKTEKGDKLFEFTDEDHGKNFPDDMLRDVVLDISGMRVEDKIHLSVSYSNKQYETATMSRLMKAYRHQLQTLIEKLSAEEETTLTPVDLTYKGLSVEQLKQLNELS